MVSLSNWNLSLPQGKRAGLLAGAVLVAAFFVAGSYWVLREEYEVLFTSVSPKDAAVIANQLQAMHIDSRVDGQGNILVPKGKVYEARVGVMSEVPDLKASVGYEIFDKSDFGITETAQRINYQRALEGELARTIAALAQVNKARVHLVIPQTSLFKRADTKPTASVIVFLKNEQMLERKQVAGIQRLVASAVQDLEWRSVNIIDQRGTTLSGAAGGQGSGEHAGSDLEAKQAIEAYLAQKAEAVLRVALPEAAVAVSVDAALDLAHVKTVKETVGDGAATMVLRRRESEPGTDGKARTVETEYAVAKRVEEIVSSPGAIARLSVAATVVGAEPAEEARLRKLVAGAVGLNEQRGDQMALYTSAVPLSPNDKQGADESTAGSSGSRTSVVLVLVIAGVGFAVIALLIWRARMRRSEPAIAPMTAEQRQAALVKINAWLLAGESTAADHAGRD